MTTAYVTHADCLLNDIGPGHPECPDRLASVNESMRTSRLVTELRCLEAPSAEPLDLKRVHHGAYVDLIFENAPGARRRRAAQRLASAGFRPCTSHHSCHISACRGACRSSTDGVVKSHRQDRFDRPMKIQEEIRSCSMPR